MSKKCPECHKEVRTAAPFCEFCGNKFPKELAEIDKLRDDLLREKEENLKLKNALETKEDFLQKQAVEFIKQVHQEMIEDIKTLKKQIVINVESTKKNEKMQEEKNIFFDFNEWKKLVLNKQ
jgi:uncharacterized protein YllA (UPF0747 family)